jgi:hypothetical protein
MGSNDKIRQDPTGGAKSAARGKRPRDSDEPESTLPESGIHTDADSQGRDAERAFEQGIAKLPPG